MGWLRIAFARVRALFRRDALADEIREELDFHLDMRAREYTRGGLTADDARREAARRLGNVAVLRDKGYDVRGAGVMESILQDIRFGARSLRHAPGFTTVAVTVLALAIGAGTAIFSVVDAVSLRGLPYQGSERLAAVFTIGPISSSGATTQTFLDWRQHQTAFDGMAMVSPARLQLKADNGEPALARVQHVTSEFFSVVGVAPLRGRVFTLADEIESDARVVALGYGFWQRRYGGADVVGGTLEVGGRPWRIVGVLPKDFSYPPAADPPTDFYVPRAFRAQDRIRGTEYNYDAVIGRLKPGVSLGQAQQQMGQLTTTLNRQYPQWEPGSTVRVIPLHEHLVGRSRQWMLLLLGSVAFVLLIACGNVANLMLARATARGREIGLRAALGASRGRIVRALLLESMMVWLTAGAIGIAVASVGVRVLRAWLPAGIPRVAEIGLDLRVLGASAAAALFTGLIFGLIPAFQGSRSSLATTLRDGGRSLTASRRASRMRNGLVVAEIALAVVLLVGAGLFLSSFLKLMDVEPGFNYRNVLVLPATVARRPLETPEAWERRGELYIDQLLRAVREAPGVTGAAAVNGGVPLTGSYTRTPVALPDGTTWRRTDAVDMRRVTPGYFPLLQLRLRDGRLLLEDDRVDGPPVAVINDSAAKKYWPGRSALGQQIVINGKNRTVVGIVGDLRHYGPEQPARQEAYVPFAQDAMPGASLLIRTDDDAAGTLPAVKAAIWSVNPNQLLAPDIATLEGYMDRMVAQRRFNMAVLAILGALGLVIAAAGIFGVMAYVVSQRTREFGVRLALGASPARIVLQVLRGATVMIGCGLAIGSVAAWRLTGFAETFLFQVRPSDARVFAAAIGVLAVVGLAAAVVPARRAAAVDPLASLKHE